ncbi:hypothetical protein CHS0354_006239 [Potamilus streckersoni]|uniref:CABIT domain-containing protein n=1 Tax=Potamilus streckersoni TaxID=2493646 RepID=A0AAE0VPW6_9BIVA|nr:hypothetical protein CHS0354_006239 [Potamilus streckersoni]
MAVSRPESKQIIWDDKPRTFKELVTGSRLPCILKIVSGDIASHLPPGKVFGEECQIISVLELRKHKMLIIRKLKYDRKNGEYTPTEQTLEIPVSHKGWFEPIPNDGRVVEYFDSISAITSIRPKQFLVRSSLVGYQLNTDNGISNWVPHEVEPGEVLRTGVVHMDQKKNRKKPFLKRMFNSGKSGRRGQELKYLQCFDRKGMEIMIPLIIAGVFSPIGDVSRANYDAVYALHDLVMTFDLPLKAKLVFSENIGKDKIPPGVVLFESVVDHENVLVAKHPYEKNESETFEIPVNAEILLVKEKRRKGSKNPDLEVQNSTVETNALWTGINDITISNGPVNLPIRVKDSKRSKGSSIFDKLTVRSKAKKERASIKALQEIGVFSSRLSKSEINFENLFVHEAEDMPEKEPEYMEDTDIQDTPIRQGDTSQSDQDQKRFSMQGRDLPPIPVKAGNYVLGLGDKDGLYEELPSRAVMDDANPNEQEDSDGYIEPSQVRNPYAHRTTDGTRKTDKTKPPTAPRPRRKKGDVAQNVALCGMEDQIIDKTFDCKADLPNERGENSHANRQIDRQIYAFGHIPFKNGADHTTKGKRGSYMYDDSVRLHADSEIEQKELLGFPKLKSPSARNLDIDVNATIRSNNIRRKRAVMDVFPNGDPVKDFRQSMTFSVDDHGLLSAEPGYGRIVENDRVKSYIFGNKSLCEEQNTSFSESEPDFGKQYHRSLSQTAMSDTYLKYGNDSAISLCSRGEYGMPGGSEYSYSEYSERFDDGWVPPADIKNLSVLEVSKSLRYIGMKDRIVIRFANEQIDGNMLCSLDEKLLREGFTELNALERKKILDFILGWRPKK